MRHTAIRPFTVHFDMEAEAEDRVEAVEHNAFEAVVPLSVEANLHGEVHTVTGVVVWPHLLNDDE